jgi:hypothetical protein
MPDETKPKDPKKDDTTGQAGSGTSKEDDKDSGRQVRDAGKVLEKRNRDKD